MSFATFSPWGHCRLQGTFAQCELLPATSPRLCCASQSQLLALGTLSVASTPLFFVYLKTPARFHNDWLAICAASLPHICLVCAPSRPFQPPVHLIEATFTLKVAGSWSLVSPLNSATSAYS